METFSRPRRIPSTWKRLRFVVRRGNLFHGRDVETFLVFRSFRFREIRFHVAVMAPTWKQVATWKRFANGITVETSFLTATTWKPFFQLPGGGVARRRSACSPLRRAKSQIPRRRASPPPAVPGRAAPTGKPFRHSRNVSPSARFEKGFPVEPAEKVSTSPPERDGVTFCAVEVTIR